MLRLDISKLMKKRGQTEIVGVVFLVGLVIVGSIAAHKIISENRYVGDKSSKLYYDLKKCDLEEVSKENLINFQNLKEVEDNGYTPAKCSQ